MGRVFIADTDLVFAEKLQGTLSGRGFSVTRCDDGAALSVAIGFGPDIAFIDTVFARADDGDFVAAFRRFFLSG